MGETILKKPAERLVALLMAFVLVVTMVPVVPAMAYVESDGLDDATESGIEEIADELCDGDVDEEFYEEVVDGLEDLESVGLESEYVTGVEESDDGLVYAMELPEGTSADVTILEDDIDDISLLIEEGEISSTLTFDEDGRIYLNGVLLEFEVDEEEDCVAAVAQSGDLGSYYTSTNPRPGKSWKWYETVKGSVKLPTEVSNVGEIALSTIINSIPVSAKWAKVFKYGALAANVIIALYPQSRYASVKRVAYKPYYNGKMYTRVKLKKLGTRRVEENIFSYYASNNCTGNIATVTTRYLIGD